MTKHLNLAAILRSMSEARDAGGKPVDGGELVVV